MQTKSPFYVVNEFVSPLMCEDIIYRLNNTYPDTDVNDVPLKRTRYNKLSELRILPLIEDLLPTVEQYYGFETEGILPFKFEWFITDTKVEPHKSDAFTYIKNAWVRTSDISFTGVIFLNEYNTAPPFDNEFEVYGGKLEFLTHQFGFNPKRGTMIFYPEAPNFINTTSLVQAGELNQIRLHIVATVPYKYNITNFPGNYKVWFKDQ